MKASVNKNDRTVRAMMRKACLLLTVSALFLCGCAGKKEETEAAAQSEANDAGSIVFAELKEINAWEENGEKVRQYELRIHNQSEQDFADWQVILETEENASIRDCWNMAPDTREGRTFVLSAMTYNRQIPAKETYRDAGLIISGQEAVLKEIRIDCGGETITAGSDEMAVREEKREPVIVTPAKTENIVGRLHIEGTRLVDEDGETVQLQGISLHGIAWFPQFVSKETFAALRDEWGVNLIRIPVYTAEYGGYCSGGDQDELKKLVDEGVQACSELGLYVIIDWHILSDNDPTMNEDEAVRFFDEMSQRYRDFDNVIFEICNEPQNSPWESVIRPYAERIIKVIRDNGSDALVIVGTNTWSQDIDEVIGSQVDDSRVLYAMHFYVSTHKDDLRNRLQKAVDAGVPVIVSECGISEASGSGIIDYDSADAWFSLLYENHIGFAVWNLSNKDETSALIRPECEKTSAWTQEDLSEGGKWISSLMKQNR